MSKGLRATGSGDEARRLLAAGQWIVYAERDTPEGFMIREHPDGRKELVDYRTRPERVVSTIDPNTSAERAPVPRKSWVYWEQGVPENLMVREYPSGRRELVDFNLDPPRVVSVLPDTNVIDAAPSSDSA